MNFVVIPITYVLFGFMLKAIAQPAPILTLDYNSPSLSGKNQFIDFAGISNIITPNVQPIKSKLDKRKYRYLVLSNQLKVLLISDKEVESSAAAINVAVGANQNPKDRVGMAHFLEHMLFLGTKKYPHPGEYQQFIAQEGGIHNASTGAENTQFYFTIRHQAFMEALDRFAQFFIAPLFNDVYVDRERQTVHAEFSAKLRDDFRREWDVYRELMSPQHPGSRFTVGNNLTLADNTNGPVRDELVRFYKQHYSSDKMTLVLLSNQSLDELQKLAEQLFTSIPLYESVNTSETYPPLFESNFLPATVEIQPEKEIRQLSFNFPVPQSKELFLNKPYQFIGHLLGHENNGSLLSILKRLGWADAVNVELVYPNKHDALFQVSIQLTSKGVRAKDQIVSLLFFFINEIRDHGVENWRYQELQALMINQFVYDEKISPGDTVIRLAQNMQDYPIRDILRGQTLFSRFDPKQLQESLGYLNKNNVLITFTAPEIQPWRISSIYSVPYSVKRGIVEIFDIRSSIRQQFSLPKENPFVPEKLVVKSASLLDGVGENAVPTLLVEKNHTKIWYKQDHQFDRPQSSINLRLIVPPEEVSAEHSALNHLFARMIQDQLNEVMYFARLAGLEFEILPHARGIDVSIFGFSNRQSLLLNYGIAALSKPEFSQNQFNRIKAELVQNYRNQNKNLPYQVLMAEFPSVLIHPEWPVNELATAVEKIKYEHFSLYAKQFLWDAKIEGLIYGNYMPQEAVKLSAVIEHGLQSRQTGRRVSDSILTIMPEAQQKPWLFNIPLEHHDKAVALYIQAPSSAAADSARMLLIRQILQPKFFHELRTEKQMGYVVAVAPLALKQIEGSFFIVQSPNASVLEIIKTIDEFLENYPSLDEKEFTTQKDSLIQKLQESPRSIREQSGRYWQSILLQDPTFDRKQKVLAALQKLSFKELQLFYQSVYKNKNRRLWLSTEAVTEESFELLND